MIRKIVKINEEKCNGCGLCIDACHEGALALENGKARLVSDIYCDGLGDCLPECPTGAIEIIEREADAFDEAAVQKRLEEMGRPPYEGNKESPCACPTAEKKTSHTHAAHTSGCPGSRTRIISKNAASDTPGMKHGPCAEESSLYAGTDTKQESQLRQWPCQIKLVHPNAPYFDNAHLLVAADCTAYAYAGIHSDFMKDRITIIGCPKLDHTDYSQKLAAILANNDIQSITVLRMEVPCCSGLVHAVRNAMLTSGKVIPWNVVTVSVDGNIVK